VQVGKEIVNVLRDRGFPTDLASLRLFASPRSAGKPQAVPFGAPGCGPVEVVIEAFSVAAARECDFVFLAVSGTFALEHAEAMAAPGGAVVIDNSSAFRLHDAVPLVVPECNPGALGDARLIANPNCTTAIAAVALWPLHQTFGLRKVWSVVCVFGMQCVVYAVLCAACVRSVVVYAVLCGVYAVPAR
jgi:aspartate-semialdehyde dehydrogenase